MELSPEKWRETDQSVKTPNQETHQHHSKNT